MQDIVAMAVFGFFYFCGATAVAVLAKNWKELIDVYRGDELRRDYYVAIADRAMKVRSAAIAVTVSLRTECTSFRCIINQDSIVMIDTMFNLL